MAAVAHPPETLAIVGAGRHEDDVHALLADHAREFRELDVVADQDGNAAKGRVENAQVVPWVAAPFFLLPAGQMDLLLGEMLAFGCEQIGGVEQLAVGDGGMASTDDVHPHCRARSLNSAR